MEKGNLGSIPRWNDLGPDALAEEVTLDVFFGIDSTGSRGKYGKHMLREYTLQQMKDYSPSSLSTYPKPVMISPTDESLHLFSCKPKNAHQRCKYRYNRHLKETPISMNQNREGQFRE